MAKLRAAHLDDIGAMHRVRLAVRENRLTSGAISEAEYVEAIRDTGRGWVVAHNGMIVGFAVGNVVTGNIWALFVHPDHERRGYGRLLHDAMVDFLIGAGLPRLWLATDPGTRAQTFYEKAGWRFAGEQPSGEYRYELDNRLNRAPAMDPPTPADA